MHIGHFLTYRWKLDGVINTVHLQEQVGVIFYFPSP